MRPLIGLLLCASCASTLPPVRQHSSLGPVYAYTREDAEALATFIDEVRPSIEAKMQTDPGPLDLIFVDRHSDAAGWTSAEGALGISAETISETFEAVLIHELVHWYATGPWDPLPVYLEEGVCEWVMGAILVVDGRRLLDQMIEENLAEGVTPDLSLMEITVEEIDALPSDERERVYQAAFETVRAIGFERLREAVFAGELEQLLMDQLRPRSLISEEGTGAPQCPA